MIYSAVLRNKSTVLFSYSFLKNKHNLLSMIVSKDSMIAGDYGIRLPTLALAISEAVCYVSVALHKSINYRFNSKTSLSILTGVENGLDKGSTIQKHITSISFDVTNLQGFNG